MSAALDEFRSRFPTPEVVRAFLENIRWPDGKPVCPRCSEKIRIRAEKERKVVGGRQHQTRPGLYMCIPCWRQFTVTTGTAFHGVAAGTGGGDPAAKKTHAPMDLSKWLLAWWLLTVTTKPITIAQLGRALDVQYTTASCVGKRIGREIKRYSLA